MASSVHGSAALSALRLAFCSGSPSGLASHSASALDKIPSEQFGAYSPSNPSLPCFMRPAIPSVQLACATIQSCGT